MTLNDGSSVYSNVAPDGIGGGIFNEDSLYLCGGTVHDNQAAFGDPNIGGQPAKQCPATPPPGGPGPGENPSSRRVLLDHKGKELCLPKAAPKGHLEHGDEIISEEGCFNAASSAKNEKSGRDGGARSK